MNMEEVLDWCNQSERRKRILLRFDQPLTAKQLSHRQQLPLDTCSYLLLQLAIYRVVTCLNPSARRGRLYWLTNLGKSCQRKSRQQIGLAPLRYTLPEIDWETYGWICFCHRSAVIKALDRPMQCASIKRQAASQNPGLRMSANNTRDILRLFIAKGIVRVVKIRKKIHPRFELTESGQCFRQLLLQATTGPSNDSTS